MARPKVLLMAESCNPEWVSVPLVGWSLANALRKVADIHLVTQVRNREAVLRAGLVEGRDFTAIDTEDLARPVHRLGNVLRMGTGKGWTTLTALNALTYPLFEKRAWRLFGPRIEAGEFEIVHRITPLTPTAVSPIARRASNAGARFVMGPLNGGLPWPAAFDAERRAEREWLSYVRGAYRWMPGRRAMYEAASAIIYGSRHTGGEIDQRYRGKCVYIPENAVDPARFHAARRRWAGGPVKVCFIGRLVPYKGADMLIEAAAPLLRAGRLSLEIVGDGPMRDALSAQVARAGLSETVVFRGWLAHAEVSEALAGADLLGFPSIREFGGAVALEAMAMGVPPLVVDYGGPGEYVTDAVGYKTPMGTRAEIVAALTKRLGDIVEHPEDLARKGAAAATRVTNFYTWEAKAAQILDVYSWVLGRRPDRPDMAPTLLA